MNLTTDVSHAARAFSRFEFLTESTAVGSCLLMVLILGSLVGTFGNLLILVALCKSKKINSLECIFIGNLALSDLYVTIVADPMSIVAKLEGENFFNAVPGLCQTIAYMCTIACVNSLGSITLMSFNRYISICHYKYYNTIFKKPTCIAMCICLYIVGLTLVLFNLAGIGDHSFDRKSLECIWDRMATYYYTVVFSVVLVWVPVALTGILYLNIYITVQKSSKRMKGVTNSNHNRKSIRLARTLFIIYVAFSLCWIPYALIIVIDNHDSLPHEPHLILTVLGHMHPSINWLIYYFTNTKFRHAFNDLVKMDRLCKVCTSKAEEEHNRSRAEINFSDDAATRSQTNTTTKEAE